MNEYKVYVDNIYLLYLGQIRSKFHIVYLLNGDRGAMLPLNISTE